MNQAPLNIQPGKPNRGPVYMGTCVNCDKRKRLNQDLAGRWSFWCSCGVGTVALGTTQQLEALMKEQGK